MTSIIIIASIACALVSNVTMMLVILKRKGS